MKSKPITIKGIKYASLRECAKAYNISVESLSKRLQKGSSLGYYDEDALIAPDRRKGKRTIITKGCFSKDHLGNMYSSLSEMARAYKIGIHTFWNRLDAGWSVEKALTTPARYHKRQSYQDHLGNTYSTIFKMLKAYNVSYYKFKYRLSIGFDLEKALTAPNQKRGRKKIEPKKGNNENDKKSY